MYYKHKYSVKNMTKFYRNRFTIGDIPQLDAVAFVMPIPTSGLNLWLKADAISGLTNGQTISSWNDSSGKNNHAVQANTSYQPKFYTSVINGLPTVRFDGNSDYIESPNGVFAGMSTDATVFLIAKGAEIKTQVTFSAHPNEGSNRILAHLPYTGSVLYWDFGNISAGGRLSGSWGGSVNTFYLWTLNAGSGSMAVRRNKSQILSTSSSSTFTPGTKIFRLGGDGNDGWYNGDISEIIVYNRKLSSEEITQVENYLASKYNI